MSGERDTDGAESSRAAAGEGSLRVLVVTKGHPFDKGAFFDLVDGLDGIETTCVEQPAARHFFHPERARQWDCFLCYDMPGIHFGEGGPRFETPPPDFVRDFEALLASGFGIVFLHHALAGWPAWPGFAEIVGGRFLYLPGELRGRRCEDSGYRHGVEHEVSVCDPAHPVVAGVPAQFKMTDELYLAEVFEDSVTPLLRSGHRFEAEGFYSAAHAVRDGRMYSNEGWTHAPGSDLVGWIKRAGRSPICYLQGGDDPVAYASPEYRRLLGNALHWVASEEASSWARQP